MRCPKGLRSIGSNNDNPGNHAMGHFRVPKTLSLKTRQVQNLSRENEFHLHENEKIIFISKSFAPNLALKPEAWCNPEMAYFHDNAKNSSGRRSANMTDD